jgi:hypothetical protein
LSKPVRRLALVSASSTASPKTVPRVWLRIDTLNLEDYNMRLGGACFS